MQTSADCSTMPDGTTTTTVGCSFTSEDRVASAVKRGFPKGHNWRLERQAPGSGGGPSEHTANTF